MTTIESAVSDLLEFGIITPVSASASAAVVLSSPIELLRQQIDSLAQKLLPEAIGLTDAFGFTDWDLSSEVRCSLLANFKVKGLTSYALGRKI